MKIGFSDILRCFDAECVGSKVLDKELFLSTLEKAAEEFDWSSCDYPGQGFIPVSGVENIVSGGDGLKTSNQDDYVVRSWRGDTDEFLKREFAAPVSFVGVVFYTKAAYLADKDVNENSAEVKRAELSDYTHFIVAVIASGAPAPPVTFKTFVKNLAGANNAYAEMSKEDLVDLAMKVVEFHSKWCTVAD